MHIFTKRNALLGWIVYRVARRRLEHKVESVSGRKRRRGLIAGLGLAAAGGIAAIALLARRGHSEPAHAGA
ncbi:MAG TPA: hypothetical protein VGF10_06170 [Gaiella sp.]|jgi:hypothetical protein